MTTNAKGMKPLYQHEHEALLRCGDRSRVKTCRWCGSEIDDAQEYCSDECLLKDEQQHEAKGEV